MRQVSIKELRKALGQELESLPFVITKRGIPIAKCTPISKCTPDEAEKCTPDSQEYTSECTPNKQVIIQDKKAKIEKMPGGSDVFFKPMPKKPKK